MGLNSYKSKGKKKNGCLSIARSSFLICESVVFINILYLSGGPGQIVRVKQVDVIPGSQQKTTSLLVQQLRVGVEAIGGAEEQRHTASLQQFWPTERATDRQDKETNKEINESWHTFHNAPSSIELQYVGEKKHLSRIKMSR